MVTDMVIGTDTAAVVLAATVIEGSRDTLAHDDNDAGEGMDDKSGGTRSGKSNGSMVGNK